MTTRTLLNCTFTRTADQVLDQLAQSGGEIKKVRIWLFEDEARRHELEGALAKHGIKAHVYSAYKPLVHFFLEEVDINGLTAVTIDYPVHPGASDVRFRLEAYPLVRMLPNTRVDWSAVPVVMDDGNGHCWYSVCLRYGSRVVKRRVLAPNVVRKDVLGQRALVPSAWLIVHQGAGATARASASASAPAVPVHMPLVNEYQHCYDAVMQAVAVHDWGQAEPYFDRLIIRASLPGIERPLGVGQECISTTEAMHEDLYFSLLEFFQRHSGRAQGSRGLQPGQIIPDIRLENSGVATVNITIEPVEPAEELQKQTADQNVLPVLDQTESAVLDQCVSLPSNPSAPLSWLTAVSAPMPQADIEVALYQFTGRHFVFSSYQNRPVHGVYIKGNKPAVVISGAQHANETSGVVGALRACSELRHDSGAHFVLMPLENPDGYAMHQALCKHNPTHMQHAARYTALGDDVEYREHAPWFERQGRDHAFSVSRAGLHLNLHGYPAHEWTRPCTGYLPRGFELWGIPKGFFLILRYRPDEQEKAYALLAHVCADLAKNEKLAAFNERQLATYRQHAGTIPFDVMHGVPYMATAVEKQTCGVTLITEFPDETIYGDDFIFAHTVQCETVKAAARWWWGN